MAEEKADSKKLKISESQQYIILAVLGASIFLGVAISLVLSFFKQMSFNNAVLGVQDDSIKSFSSLISTIGICTAPSNGFTYSIDELKKCDPETIDISQIPGTLRANILTELAANEALNSVPKESDTSCINPKTRKNYTYKELEELNSKATESGDAADIKTTNQLFKSCSALRVIPDALPAYKNEEALLASLNQLFLLANWVPESLSPSNNEATTSAGVNLNALSVNLLVETDYATTIKVLNNIEHSIREFDIEKATIEFGGKSELILEAKATAYYMNRSEITSTTTTIQADGTQSKPASSSLTEEEGGQ